MNIDKGTETMHYLPWHKDSSLDSEVNYLSQLLHVKWCNSHERSREMVIFFSPSFHSIKHLLTEFMFTPVGLALKFVFTHSCVKTPNPCMWHRSHIRSPTNNVRNIQMNIMMQSIWLSTDYKRLFFYFIILLEQAVLCCLYMCKSRTSNAPQLQ